MSESTVPILQAFKGDKRRWFSLAGAKPRLPETSPDLDFFNVSGAAANPELIRISREDAVKCLARNQDAKVMALRKTPADFALSFAGLVKDGDGNGWDLLLGGSCTLKDIRDFLARYGAEAVTPETPVSKTLLESWLAGTVQTQVKDAVAETAIEDLRDKDALPARWWETQFNKWLSPAGLSFKIASARWESADAARAEAERLREREMQRIAQERDRQLQAELREAKAKTDYETEKSRIEADRQLTESERAHQLQVLELRHRKEVLAAETEIENARRAAEQAALEHELAKARLAQDIRTVESAEIRMAKAEQDHVQLMQVLNKASLVLEQLGRMQEPLLQQLANRDRAKADAAAEFLVSPSFGITPSALAALGFTVDRQRLVESLRSKAVNDGEIVSILKSNWTTRDIGTAKVKVLPINTSLQFEISSGRSGFLTLLNVGTSGSVYVHVPNAKIRIEKATVLMRKAYAIPGPDLLPWEWLRDNGLDYVECGPPGWEHIVGIVSDEPVIAPDILARSTAESPIVRLTPEEVGLLFAKLEDLPAEKWSSGVLSFLVG